MMFRYVMSEIAEKVDCAAATAGIVAAGRDFYRRGWVLGTSGNFSAVLEVDPRRVLITRSGADKGALTEQDFLTVDGTGAVVEGMGRPSAETALHLAIVSATGAGAVMHTHSVSSTVFSQKEGKVKSIAITGYEMLKGLSGVQSHTHRESLPILDNSQDYPALAGEVEKLQLRERGSHGFLLRAHGLYTWGVDVNEARRHTEILEFLIEVMRWQS
jgi:methylthioribulose-1-phosphate dehydratase